MLAGETVMKKYLLKEYGSWGVMSFSFLTGVLTADALRAEIIPAFLALALFINSKQAFTLWVRSRDHEKTKAFGLFAAQVLSGTGLLITVLRGGLVLLLPYAVIPVMYLLFLKYLGEHAIYTEIMGFLLLSVSTLIAKVAAAGAVDPRLFSAVAIFFVAGVFRVRVQLKKTPVYRTLMVAYPVCAALVYAAMRIPLLALLPLADNLLFATTLYKVNLRATGWIEVTKGIAFMITMALTYA
jgi:hypothetical protein